MYIGKKTPEVNRHTIRNKESSISLQESKLLQNEEHLCKPVRVICNYKWLQTKLVRWWSSRWAISNPKRWCCESAALSMPANLENSSVATGLEKVSFHSNPKERQCQRMFRLLHNWTHFHASKVILKILQARLQQYVNWELPDVQTGFRKGRWTGDQIANICSITEKAREFQKNIYFCFIDYTKAFDSVDTTNCGRFLKRWEYQTILPVS